MNSLRDLGVSAVSFSTTNHHKDAEVAKTSQRDSQICTSGRNWAHSAAGRELPLPRLSPIVEWVPNSSIACGSQSPPMIPDGRISRIRFEAAAYTLCLPKGRTELKPMVDIRSLRLTFAQSLASVGISGSVSTASDSCSHLLAPRAQRSFAPEALPSFIATTTSCATPEASRQLRFHTRWSVFAAWTIHCWSPGSSRRYLCESFPGCWALYSGGTLGCFCLFLPPGHRPSPSIDRVGYPRTSAKTTSQRAGISELQTISLRSGLQVCSVLQVVPTAAVFRRQGSQDFLLPSRSC